MSHVVPHMKNHHGDNSPLDPKGTRCSATSYADNTRFGLSPILGESEGCSEKRALSLHRVTTLAAWTNDEKVETTFLGIESRNHHGVE